MTRDSKQNSNDHRYMEDYQVVSYTEVLTFSDNGYEPLGGIAFGNDGAHQAMVLYETVQLTDDTIEKDIAQNYKGDLRQLIHLVRNADTDSDAMKFVKNYSDRRVLEALDRIEFRMKRAVVIDTASGWRDYVKDYVQAAIEREKARHDG